MGLLDRFRTPAPVDQKPVGASGRFHFNGLIELDELNQHLVGTQGLLKFDEMYRTDPDISRLVLLMWAPLLSATWSVKPYGGDEATPQDVECAELVEWALWENMTPNLMEHLNVVGPVLLRSGFAPFEQVWQSADYQGRQVVVPRKLDLRLPRTIWKWYQDDFGDLTQIVQLLPNARQAVIDTKNVCYYRVGQEGDNWMGKSMLRAAYKPWYIKDKLERIDAIGQERKAVGVPIVYPPQNADDTTKGEVETILANLHVNEVGYVISPGPHAQDDKDNGWRFEIITFDSSSSNGIQESLRYHSDKIGASVLADFMQLGHHQVGARATAEVQEDPFLGAESALGQIVLDELNNLVDRIAALNFPNLEGAPKLTLSITDSASLSEIATYVQGLITAGVMQSDPELEDYLRDRADLPPANPEVREEKKQQQAAGLAAQQESLQDENGVAPGGPGYQGPAPRQIGSAASGFQNTERQGARAALEAGPKGDASKAVNGPAKAKALSTDSAWWEDVLSQGKITEAIDTAKQRFENTAAPAAVAIARQMAQRVGTGRQIPTDVMDDDLTAAIMGELQQLYMTGYGTVVDEIQGQHAKMGTGKTVRLDDEPSQIVGSGAGRLRQRAKTAARNVSREIGKASERAGLRSRHPASIQQAGESAARTALRTEGRLNASAAINMGRRDAALANRNDVVGGIYTSVLDERSCDPCIQSDDGIVRDLDDPVLDSLGPPNPDCEGQDNCRCMIVYVLTSDGGQ